ncbi:hypothetical protein HAX54_032479 [Datura stramonium]|uniref:Uncharacterized protein n=1 Tax=Datura stramonium TaxID=4076 RepID=A0ABS8VBM5_DATST|nr:hypothetical protein [Datura stramonium]
MPALQFSNEAWCLPRAGAHWKRQIHYFQGLPLFFYIPETNFFIKKTKEIVAASLQVLPLFLTQNTMSNPSSKLGSTGIFLQKSSRSRTP